MEHSPRGRSFRRSKTLPPGRSGAPGRRPALAASSSARQAWRAAAPWFGMTAILGSIGVGLLVMTHLLPPGHQSTSTDTLIPIAALLLAVSSAPFVLGLVRLLATPPPPPMRRCGLCKYYRAIGSTYGQGLCTIDRQYHLTYRQDACDRFIFSERAMVRDRLSDAPHVLNVVRHPEHDG